MTPSTRRITRHLGHDSHNRWSGKDPFPHRQMLTYADPHGHVNQRHNRHSAKTTTAARTWARLAVNPGATTPQEGMCSWALGSSSRRKHRTPRHKRHNANATTVAQAWASLGASPGATNATRRCTSLGVGLLKPSNHPRPHSRQTRQPPPAPPRRIKDTCRTCLGALVLRKTADRRDPFAAPRHKPPGQPRATKPQEQGRSWALGTSAHRSTPSNPRRRSAVARTARAQTPGAPSLSGHSFAHSIEKLTVVITGSPQRVTLWANPGCAQCAHVGSHKVRAPVPSGGGAR